MTVSPRWRAASGIYKVWLFDLSLRHKIPLWGSVLILVTAAAISISFGLQAYDDLKSDTIRSSENLGRTLIKTLNTAIMQDDVWRAYEVIKAPYHGESKPGDPIQIESLIVVNKQQEVFVSSHPQRYPVQAKLSQLGGNFQSLDKILATARDSNPIIIDHPRTREMLMVLPIVADDVVLGGLIMVHSKSLYSAHFLKLAERAALITLLVLAVLLPINWYWGRRMAVPLVSLAKRLGAIGEHVPDDLEPGLYAYKDELGRLFRAFSTMLHELKEKEFLEKQMVQSERMAAIGHLTAGIAHEINNPLAGMLTAIDTLKRHGSHDPVTDKTISLLERGLQQIRETLAALLVEARFKSHDLIAQDIDDVSTLLAPQAEERSTRIEVNNAITANIPLPSTLIRQIMINLLLNAVQAAGKQGHVVMEVDHDIRQLQIRVSNDGKQIPDDKMNYLFEPFSSLSESGHGLGLWVTFQIVQQLGGRITAESREGATRFTVTIPLGDES